MLGAIIGDIAGSRFEWNNQRTKNFELLTHVGGCKPTDDSIMSLAIAQALLEDDKQGSLRERAIRNMQRLGAKYPEAGYGGFFSRWLRSNNPQPYNSFGNGAAMRVSACGFAAKNVEEAKNLAHDVTCVTHNHPEGIKGAEAVAVAIYLAREGRSILEIRDYIVQNYYDISFALDDIRSTYTFDETCQGTVPQAFEAFFESISFEDAIRNAISIGGDSDTIAAITGSIAEAYYGIPADIRKLALTFLDETQLGILNAFEARYGIIVEKAVAADATRPISYTSGKDTRSGDRQMADEVGLTEDERSKVAQRVRMAAIMKDPERIHAVCEHIAEHFMTKINPNGFKAQVVCYDRECCVLYKKELDKLLGETASTIVMDTNNDKADEYKKWRRTRDEEAKVLDDFRDPANPLQIVIVTSKLLTGFDAPILQAMYLDKPMKDHTLLQAICRTNRVYGQDKTYGLIVDYVGIFDDVAKALAFDADAVEKIITNIDGVKSKVPELVAGCLRFFLGVDRTSDDWEALVAAQDCIPTDKDRDEFGAQYRVLNRVWNALSPDDCLTPFKADYRWLSKVYDSVRPVDERGKLIWAALGSKTLQLVHENISVEEVVKDEEVLEMDAAIIEQFIAGNTTQDKRRRKIELDLAAIIRKHPNDARFIELGERMEKLREEHEAGLLTSMEFLKALLEMAKDAARMEREVIPEEEIDKGVAMLTKLFQSIRNTSTPIIVERIVSDIDGIVKIVRFPGWQNSPTGRKTVSRSLRDVIMRKYRIKDKEVFDKAYSYVEQYY